MLIFVTKILKFVPSAEEVLLTVTSLEAESEPLPMVVEPTLIAILPAVLLNPPKEALTSLNVAEEGRVNEKVMLEAGLFDEPI